MQWKPTLAASSAGSSGVNLTELSVQILSPRRKGDVQARRAHAHELIAQRAEVHLDSALAGIPARFVRESAQVEVAIQLAVDAPEEVEVERRRDASRIVIGGEELRDRFDQIGAEQESVALAQARAHVAQEDRRARPVEVADRAAEEQQEQGLGSASGAHGALQPVEEIALGAGERDARQVADLAPAALER
jgi:hypothetical protein